MSVGIEPDDGRSITDEGTLAAVDEIDGRPHLVVADVARDDAWIAVAESVAVRLDERV